VNLKINEPEGSERGHREPREEKPREEKVHEEKSAEEPVRRSLDDVMNEIAG
jgi:hypothetical protein